MTIKIEILVELWSLKSWFWLVFNTIFNTISVKKIYLMTVSFMPVEVWKQYQK
jgi:hypothetical protein